MTQRTQNARSSVTGNRPPNTRPVGEFYVNFADLQMGVMDPTSIARDLLPIRYHSPSAQFAAGDMIASAGRLYRAKAVIAPKAFAYADWTGISDTVNVLDFGAKVDGTTSDSAAVGAALASLKPQQAIYFPAGATNLVWGSVQGTTPATPVLFQMDGTTAGGATILRAFSRVHKGDIFENFSSPGGSGLVPSGLKYFSKRDPEVDSNGVISVEHFNDSTPGGTGGAISIPMRISVRDNPAAVTSMWGVHVAINSYSNQPGWPQNVGVSSSLLKYGSAWAAAMHITSQDEQQKPSSTGGTLLGFEIGHHADFADDSFNGAVWGNKGTRQGVAVRQSAVHSNLGLAEFSCAFTGGSDLTAITKSVFMVSLNGYAYQVFDARGPNAPPSYADPVAALRMAPGQVLDFNGGGQQDSRAGNYLQYTTAGGARLRYMDGAAEIWAISDAGVWSGSSLGTGIGQIPVFSARGGRPSYELNGQWIINQAFPTGTQGADIFIRHDGSAVTTGTSANINGLLNLTHTVGANDPTSNWTLISHVSSATTKGAQALSAFLATDRLPGSNAWAWGAIVGVTDQTGLNSSAVVNPTLAMEIDFATSGADDATNPAKIGGFGNRHIMHIIATRNQGTAQNQVTTGLWFGTSNSYIDSLIGMDVRGDADQGTKVRQVIDTRGAIPPKGVTDPVAAVRTSAGHILDLNGGPALNSPPGNYLQYTTSGTARLRYMTGAGEMLWVDNTGNLAVAGTISATNLAVATNISAPNINVSGTVTGQTLHATLDVTADRNISAQGSITANGSVTSAGNVSAIQKLFASNLNVIIGDGGSGRIMQMAGGYYFDYNPSNGDMSWLGNSTPIWVMRASDGACYNNVAWVGGHGAYRDVSDERLKTDITPATVGLPEILAIEPINFHRLGPEGEAYPDEEIGFSAQNVQPVIPEAVTQSGVGLPDALALASEPILAAVVNAIKTLNERITVLEAT